MMKKILALTLVLSLCLWLLPIPGYCARINWHGTDRTLQLGRQLPYDLVYKGVNRGGVSTIVSTVTPLTTANLAFAMIKLANGSPGVHPLPDGEIGQEITIKLLANPAYLIAQDTPGGMTMTGWTSINFDTANGWVSLTWLDDTNGWIITGDSNVTITY